MGSSAAAADNAGERRLVEDAVTLLLNDVPPGWAHLRVDFDSSAEQPVVRALVTTSDSKSVPLQVPTGVVEALSAYQAQAKARGATWRKLVIDCHADGRLSMRTDPVGGRRVPRRWPVWALASITVGCSVAAAAVFAQGWRSPAPPPRAAMIEVPAPSARQQQTFQVLKRWYDAENRGDGAALRALACAHPAKNVEDEIEGFEQTSGVQGLVYLEAVVGFRDQGDRVWGKFLYRVHPISERDTRLVEETQQHGGYFSDEYTLVQEGGELKVCDADSPPRV